LLSEDLKKDFNFFPNRKDRIRFSSIRFVRVPGYIFDFTRSCSCVQISLIASKGMVAALILVVATIVATVVGG
jgi:hypothetical protein